MTSKNEKSFKLEEWNFWNKLDVDNHKFTNNAAEAHFKALTLLLHTVIQKF